MLSRWRGQDGEVADPPGPPVSALQEGLLETSTSSTTSSKAAFWGRVRDLGRADRAALSSQRLLVLRHGPHAGRLRR